MAVTPNILNQFFAEQLDEWPFFKANNQQLKTVQKKQLEVAGDQLTVQFNPNRTTSATANLDPKSIQQRPCFLCPANRYKEQRSLVITEKFYALVNPLPIFDRHFTIVHNNHCPQEIAPYLNDFLEITRIAAPDYITVFNGAKAGASAPDHMHFQILPQASLPVLAKIPTTSNSAVIEIYGVSYIFIREREINSLCTKIGRLVSCMSVMFPYGQDCLNLICRYTSNAWEIILMPRSKARPQSYFESGQKQMIISPGYVELGGVMITVRPEDYQRMDSQRVAAILKEVTYDQAQFNQLLKVLDT